jgi:transaldolase
VLAASLTSTSDIMALAGINHITIAPVLLQKLAIAPASSLNIRSAFDESPRVFDRPPLPSFADDEPTFRMAFTRRDNGEGERKLSQVGTSIEATL